MLTIFTFVTFVILAEGASFNRFEERIVGGVDIDIEKLPYQLALGEKSYLIIFKHFCGASVLTESVALTAAHCTYGSHENLAVVHETIVGSWFQPTIDVNEVVEHPKYDEETTDCDIALLFLAEELIFNQKLQPIKFPKTEPQDNASMIVSGWGAVQEGGEGPSHLKAVVVVKYSQKLCNKLYSGELTEFMFCAGDVEGEKDSCQGDSGGPLAINGIQYGIVSWGYGCARPNQPGVYTNLVKFKDWILEYVEI